MDWIYWIGIDLLHWNWVEGIEMGAVGLWIGLIEFNSIGLDMNWIGLGG